jgi:hypothetical protein
LAWSFYGNLPPKGKGEKDGNPVQLENENGTTKRYCRCSSKNLYPTKVKSFTPPKKRIFVLFLGG